MVRTPLSLSMSSPIELRGDSRTLAATPLFALNLIVDVKEALRPYSVIHRFAYSNDSLGCHGHAKRAGCSFFRCDSLSKCTSQLIIAPPAHIHRPTVLSALTMRISFWLNGLRKYVARELYEEPESSRLIRQSTHVCLCWKRKSYPTLKMHL